MQTCAAATRDAERGHGVEVGADHRDVRADKRRQDLASVGLEDLETGARVRDKRPPSISIFG